MISYILFVLNVFSQLFLCAAEPDIFSDKFIDEINRNQTLWKAGKNFGGNIMDDFVDVLTTTTDLDKGEQFPFKKPKEHGRIPEFFDSRQQWENCKTLSKVPDQGRCGNCWAAALAASLSCRLCVQSRGRYDHELSIDHVTRCCAAWNTQCSPHRHGCYGGFPNYYYKFWLNVGIVSGGYFGSGLGCRPYSDELYYHHKRHPKRPDGSPSASIQCIESCSNERFKKTFSKYKMSGYNVNYLRYQNPIYIQLEIMNNGPVQAIMQVYKDFKTYQEGIYFHQDLIPNEKPAWHSIVIIGWGIENGVKYWLVLNTWGSDWGKFGGYFKIKRGNNECQIESRVYGALFGFGRRTANKTVKTEKTSSSMAVRTDNLVIVVNFLVLVMMYNNISDFN